MTATIFAPATPPARSAIAVIRLSGPETALALTSLAGDQPPPRRASLRRLSHQDRTLDEALVLWFPAPASFTGEDAAELHVHGGLAVVDAVSAALLALGLSPAEPGAFTRRALENGKLDLAQAEGLADLIDAETEAQRTQALDQLGGALGRRHEHWRRLVLDALASLEAAVDFPDEDLPADVADRAGEPLRHLVSELEAALAEGARGEMIRDGYRIALIGAPNAGKSSLLNALTGRDAAIVTAMPGTTRDIVEVPITLDGFRVLLADTAGLRDTNDPIEAEGVRRATAWAASAHLRLWVTDDPAAQQPVTFQPGDLRVLSKADLRRPATSAASLESVSTSTVTPAGTKELREALQSKVRAAAGGAAFPAATRARHRLALEAALRHARRALGALLHPELAAEDARLASADLAAITGRVLPDDVLDQVFASFCIGK